MNTTLPMNLDDQKKQRNGGIISRIHCNGVQSSMATLADDAGRCAFAVDIISPACLSS